MRKRLFRNIMLAYMLAFITLLLGSISVNAKKVNVTELDLSKIYGEYDFTSYENTTVIIEIEEESVVKAKHIGKVQSKSKLKSARNSVTKDILEMVPNANLVREYDYLFSGFALELPESNILNLITIPGINAIYPNVHYEETVVEMNIVNDIKPNMIYSTPYVGAPAVWELGYTGEGMTVAVIDTGVDYTHPELAHAFGEYKGYDFYDNDNDPINLFDPINETQYHGTHVAGTIVASSFGIAPDANMLAYRVLGPDGGSTNQVIAAIEQAVIDGADVMNLSLGNSLNDPDYATSIALDWAMAEGVVAVTSNGNSGPDLWTVGSPGASRDAISVGSIALPSIGYSIGFNTLNNNYLSAKVMGTSSAEEVVALDNNSYEVVSVGLGTQDEYQGVDVNGKIALIERGVISFEEKSFNAYYNGAVAAIIYNNVDEEFEAEAEFALPTFYLSLHDGEGLTEEIAIGNNELTISVSAVAVLATISDFSSKGPAYGTWMIKPDIVAPGDDILSCYPGGYYASAGGTSMASPHVAAAALLVKQAHPEYTPSEVKSVLMNTANSLIDPNTNKPYLHNEQGAGELRILDAILADTIVNPGSFSFGKFVKNNGKQVEGGSFEIQNLSNVDKTYTFKVEFFGNPKGIKLTTSNNLKVKANSSKNVNYNVQVDTSVLEPGFYEGMITVSDGTNEILVPTILFIREPDYPRVTLAGVDQVSDNDFYPYAYVPAGAEYLDVAIYSFDELNGTIGDYVGYWEYALNVDPGFYSFSPWDGTDQGYQLPKGQYVIVAYAEYLGKADAVAFLFEIN